LRFSRVLPGVSFLCMDFLPLLPEVR
jgi:hypothetical protein